MQKRKPRCLTPFFTTKSTGRGLGLSVVHGIALAHGGVITADSSLGEGSTFTLYLPATDDAKVIMPTRAPTRSGAGSILIIDDDENVLHSTRQMVDAGGYSTLTAGSGPEGIETLIEVGNEIDLVLLDLTMPGMSGHAVLTKIRERWPKLPVVLMSGFGEVETTDSLRGGFSGFLQKPFNMNELFARIEEAFHVSP